MIDFTMKKFPEYRLNDISRRTVNFNNRLTFSGLVNGHNNGFVYSAMKSILCR